jgi:hypothetical protein
MRLRNVTIRNAIAGNVSEKCGCKKCCMRNEAARNVVLKKMRL